MKSFVITLDDLLFLQAQINVPIISVVKYLTDGTPIYGYTVPTTGFTDPLTGSSVTTDPFTGNTLPSAGTVVELGIIGTPSTLAQSLGYTTFDIFNSAWSLFLPPVVTASGTTAAGVGEPFGLRNVQGLFNNISLASSAIWGAAFYAFARTSDADYGNYLQGRADNPAVLASLQSAAQLVDPNVTVDANGNIDLSKLYANPFKTVYDYTPRMISQLVDSQAALERVDLASGGAYITDNSVYQITDINDPTGQTFRVGGYDANGVATNGGLYFKESFQRNLNTLGGDPSLTGWNTLFGQFFDHGLDFIGKGGNLTSTGASSKIYIPLDPSDPLYRAPNPATGDPGNTKLYISRATVANPEAAGADGLFRTADDIQSPGVDGIYGTADDIIGSTNPNYINHVSPYIDQSQTYGSDDTVTNLLREWVIDPATGKYIAGMYLFDGNSLANSWNRQNPDGTVTVTHKTLPTLNELRAELRATGRDDLTWDDISNLRVRDADGKVLDLDPNTAGIQAKLTDHTLLADFLPRLDAAHVNANGLTAMSTLFPTYTGIIADYVNIYSGQPTALGMNNPDILGELLLRSVGDHYVAGDGRANENFGLTAIHHVWHEDHNWQIDNLINIIAQQQAADPTQTVAHAFQTAIADSNGNPYKDVKGNYTDALGNINWNQEKMFQASVLIVQSEYQHVAIDQYARGMSPNIPLFVQYDSGVNSDVTLDYSQVAFRFGHSQLRETIDTLDPLGSLTAAVTHFALEQAFLNPSGFAQVGPTAIAQGMTRQVSNEIDEIVTAALQQNLLGQATDLAAINIARGRELGMPTLNNLRRQLSSGLTTELNDLNQKLIANPSDANLRTTIDKTIALQAGLQAYSSWADFGQNIIHPESLVNFIAAYSFDGDLVKAEVLMKAANGDSLTTNEKTIANSIFGLASNIPAIGYLTKANQFLNGSDKGYEAIDAWNGGLAEKHVFLGELGPTFDAIFADQMTRLINGDRFYYFWRFQLGLPIFTELNSAIATEQFKDVIERTTGAQHLVGNVFFMADSYVELGELPPPNPDSTNNPDYILDGTDRNHKYGDLLVKDTHKTYSADYLQLVDESLLDVNGQHIGVSSIGGGNEFLNGSVTTRITGKNANGNNITEKFILDIRPDIGVNPDGTSAQGFNSHEVIGGTEFRDFIDAGDGDDTIYGGGGDDILLGNAGADHIYGEAGNDLIYGGALPDFIDGGIGDDEIHGGDDADVLIGAEGNDRLFGENFTDELHGNAGDDYLDGGLDADLIYGGSGQDVIVGGEGLDTMYGESGDDRMFGGAGPDQLFGGYGDDILNAGFGGQNQNLNVDEALGEFGFNLVSFSDTTVALNHSADLNQENVNVSNVTPFGQLWVNIQGIEGSQFNDTIIGYNGSGTVDAGLIGNWMIGGGGDDTITTGIGDDVIVGDSVRLDALIGTYNSSGVLQSNGILDLAYGSTAGAANKHFVDLLKSVPDFTFGDTVNITANGLVYTHQAVNSTKDTVIYAGDFSNFDITKFTDPRTGIVGFRIKDLRVQTDPTVETGLNGDIVIGVEKFSFNGVIFSTAQLIRNGSVAVTGYASANQPTTPNTFQLAATVTDPDTVPAANIAYQWQYSTNGTTWTAVTGATASTFKPTNTNPAAALFVPLGATIRVVSDYTDASGAIEHVISTPTQTLGRYVALTGSGNTTINVNNIAANANNNSSTDYQDVLFGNSGNNTINAGAGNDYLDGGAGNDTLNGGTGADIMIGGLGNDTYIVDDAGDVVTELSGAGSGTDLVQASITYTLGNNVENLTLTGTANIDGTGNLLNNTINGNSGNNILDGGLGADRMVGGAGNDAYIVDNVSDVVVESNNAGTDTVLSSVTYILSNNIENLTLTGTGNINGTGNNLANTIIGNSGNNRLDGMGGADAMFGGAGNDTYIVDNIGGSVTEYANEGIDTVLSSVTFALGDNVENLTLTGNGGNSGFGNALDNVITGNSGANTLSGGDGNDMLDGGAGNDTLLGGNGNDILVGGAGNDFLMGGAGNDQFSFVAKAANGNSTAFSANNMGNDTILDFTAADNDQIVLSKTTFAALMSSVVGGALNVSDFASITGSDNSAANNTAHIVYNQSTGHLIYNQNGSASGFGLSTNVNNVTFATLAGNPTLTSTNFLVQV